MNPCKTCGLSEDSGAHWLPKWGGGHEYVPRDGCTECGGYSGIGLPCSLCGVNLAGLFDDAALPGDWCSNGSKTTADLTIENVLAAMDEFKRALPPPPRVEEKGGRVYIVIEDNWYLFPEGTTRDRALSVLSEALSIAERRYHGIT